MSRPHPLPALWVRMSKNTDLSTGPLARPFARSHAPFTCLLAPHYLLRTTCFAPALRCAHSFARSLTSFASSLLGQLMIRWLFCLCFFLFSTIVPWWWWSSSSPGGHQLRLPGGHYHLLLPCSQCRLPVLPGGGGRRLFIPPCRWLPFCRHR